MDPLVVKMMPLCKWPIFSMSLVTVPQASAKVNSMQFPSRCLSGELGPNLPSP